MLDTLRQILERSLAYLTGGLETYAPPLIVGTAILLVSWALAAIVRWSVNRLFKGIAVDRFLSQSGLATMLDRSGRLRARRIAAATAFWIILGMGALTALSALNTALTTRMVDGLVVLLPRLVAAGLIVLGGVWLAQYLSRSALIWASNDGIPGARRWAAGVRIVIVFTAVVVAADYLDFARSVFLAAFVMLVAGAVLAAAIAVGSAARDAVRRQLEREAPGDPFERSLRDHL